MRVTFTQKCDVFWRSKESPRLAVKPCRLHIPLFLWWRFRADGKPLLQIHDFRVLASPTRDAFASVRQSMPVRKTNTTKHGESMDPACLTSCPWGATWSANVLRYTEELSTTCTVSRPTWHARDKRYLDATGLTRTMPQTRKNAAR